MTVEELIAELNKFDPKRRVYRYAYDESEEIKRVGLYRIPWTEDLVVELE